MCEIETFGGFLVTNVVKFAQEECSPNIKSIHIHSKNICTRYCYCNFLLIIGLGAAICTFELEHLRCTEAPQSLEFKEFEEARKGRLAIPNKYLF